MPKEEFKNLVKKHVINYWEGEFRAEAVTLRSLRFFHAPFMSLNHIHPLFWTAGNSPRQVAMATIQASMISGRYRCGTLTRHWNSDKDEGFCSLSPQCTGYLEDIDHILVSCIILDPIREKLFAFTEDYSSNLPMYLQELIMQKFSRLNPNFSQFLLDCSIDCDVIVLAQKYGDDILRHIFLITRTWIYSLHRHR